MKLNKRRYVGVFVCAALLFTGGCATSNHVPTLAEGLRPVQIEPGVYRISVLAGHFTKFSSVERALLLRSAELTLENGYQRFLMLPDDEALKAAEKAGSVRSMARKGSWGGREGLSTVGVSWGSGGVGGVHVSVKNTHGSLVTVMFKANEKRASKGIDAASTAERLKPKEDKQP